MCIEKHFLPLGWDIGTTTVSTLARVDGRGRVLWAFRNDYLSGLEKMPDPPILFLLPFSHKSTLQVHSCFFSKEYYYMKQERGKREQDERVSLMRATSRVQPGTAENIKHGAQWVTAASASAVCNRIPAILGTWPRLTYHSQWHSWTGWSSGNGSSWSGFFMIWLLGSVGV